MEDIDRTVRKVADLAVDQVSDTGSWDKVAELHMQDVEALAAVDSVDGDSWAADRVGRAIGDKDYRKGLELGSSVEEADILAVAMMAASMSLQQKLVLD